LALGTAEEELPDVAAFAALTRTPVSLLRPSATAGWGAFSPRAVPRGGVRNAARGAAGNGACASTGSSRGDAGFANAADATSCPPEAPAEVE
jgi:hypothetical protein